MAMLPPAVQDRSVRLWDLRTNICQAKLDTPAAAPCASFDQQVSMQCWLTLAALGHNFQTWEVGACR